MDANTPALSLLLRRIAGHRAAAARLTIEIDGFQRWMHQLMRQRVDGALIDAVEDQIQILRDRLVASDIQMMERVAEANYLNNRRPEHRRLDLEQTFRAMPRAAGGDHPPV